MNVQSKGVREKKRVLGEITRKGFNEGKVRSEGKKKYEEGNGYWEEENWRGKGNRGIMMVLEYNFRMKQEGWGKDLNQDTVSFQLKSYWETNELVI